MSEKQNQDSVKLNSNMSVGEIKEAMVKATGTPTLNIVAQAARDAMRAQEQMASFVQPILKAQAMFADLQDSMLPAQRLARTMTGFQASVMPFIELSNSFAGLVKGYQSALPILRGDFLAKSIASLTVSPNLFSQSLLDLKALNSITRIGFGISVETSVTSATLTEHETAAVESATDTRYSHGSLRYRRSGILSLSAEVGSLRSEVQDLRARIESNDTAELPAVVKAIRLNERDAQLEVNGTTIALTRGTREYDLCRALLAANDVPEEGMHVEEMIEARGEYAQDLSSHALRREHSGFRQAARRINDKAAPEIGKDTPIVLVSRQQYRINPDFLER